MKIMDKVKVKLSSAQLAAITEDLHKIHLFLRFLQDQHHLNLNLAWVLLEYLLHTGKRQKTFFLKIKGSSQYQPLILC